MPTPTLPAEYLTRWQRFLSTDAGKAGLHFLREEKMPPIRTTAQPHEVQMDAGAVVGYTKALADISALGAVPVVDVEESPQLENTRL